MKPRIQKQPSELASVTIIPPAPVNAKEAETLYKHLAKTVGRILVHREDEKSSGKSGAG